MDFTEDSVMRMLQQVDRIGNQAWAKPPSLPDSDADCMTATVSPSCRGSS